MPNEKTSPTGREASGAVEPVVVRLEIAMVSPDGGAVEVRAAADDEDLARRIAELDARAARLAAGESELGARAGELELEAARLQASERELEQRAADIAAERGRTAVEAGHREEELNARIADLTSELEEHQALAPRLEELRLELAEREADLALARRPTSKRATQAEGALLERVQELDQREADLDVREAEREADFELREERLEHREHDLAQLEERLRRKERELAGYVGQLQDELVRREAEWWEKLAGGDTIRH